MLAKHEKYHVDKNSSCKHCGQVFNQKWKMEQHVAKEHVHQSLECKECGKQFQWHRNLLGNMVLILFNFVDLDFFDRKLVMRSYKYLNNNFSLKFR